MAYYYFLFILLGGEFTKYDIIFVDFLFTEGFDIEKTIEC